MNTIILEQYNILLSDNSKSKFEINSYKKVIDVITNLDFKITKLNLTILKDIKYIGSNTIKRIEEILTHGKLLEYDKTNNSHLITKELMNIHGIGNVKAKKLYEQNITFENIDKHLDKLSHEQQIGVKYKDDILKKIPRKEIDTFDIILKKLLNKFNKQLTFTICGSYRRGNKTSGDIDVLIINDNKDILLQDIIKYLSTNNLLIDHLTLNGNTKYMGLTKINKISRRIDIRLISTKSYYYALLYFTGSYKTNTYMREIAKHKNWKLSEYSLIDNNKKELQVNSEQEIFELLEIDYIEPNNR